MYGFVRRVYKVPFLYEDMRKLVCMETAHVSRCCVGGGDGDGNSIVVVVVAMTGPVTIMCAGFAY